MTVIPGLSAFLSEVEGREPAPWRKLKAGGPRIKSGVTARHAFSCPTPGHTCYNLFGSLTRLRINRAG